MRVRLPCYTPDWSGSAFEKYARGWVARNGYRVRYLIGDDEDQLQECAVIFCKLKEKYRVPTPSWFMALYKSALFNAWATWAKKDWPLRNMEMHSGPEHVHVDDGYGNETFAAYLVTPRALDYLNRIQNAKNPGYEEDVAEGMSHSSAELAAAFSMFSSELKAVLGLIADAPRDLLEFLFSDETNEKVLETKLCRMAGVKHRPILAELKAALSD